MPTDKELLQQAAEHIKTLEKEIERLVAPPNSITTVQKLMSKEKVLVAGGSGSILLDVPKGINSKGLKPGVLLSVNGAGQIVEVIEVPLAGGEATVKRLFDGDMMEIEGFGGGTMVFKGAIADEVKVGDLILMDRSGTVALKTIPKIKSHSVETATGVCWNDIGGQDVAVSILQEAIEGPLKHSALYKAYGKKPLKGVLMSGPPGCGKTLIAKATANAVREAHGGSEAETGFIYVKGPEVLNMWVGNTESQIRSLFTQAREHKEEHGYPAVVFIDEADAILGKRGSSHGSILSSTIVPTFLAEMDGLVDSGAFILLATNRPDILDPAIVREGRIDRKVVVGRPGLRESVDILKIHLLRSKTHDKVDDLAGAAAGELFSESHALYKLSLKGKGIHTFYMRNLISGALLAGVVDQATSIAIQRDLKTGKASGLRVDDMKEAVVQIVRSNRGLNHDDDLLLFAETHGTEIDGAQRLAA